MSCRAIKLSTVVKKQHTKNSCFVQAVQVVGVIYLFFKKKKKKKKSKIDI
jgi:hypothetical protein